MSVIPDPSTHDLVYACRKCRTPLFRPEQLEEHQRAVHSFAQRRVAKDLAAKAQSGESEGAGHIAGADTAGVAQVASSGACTSFFMAEPVKWMAEPTSAGVEGKLLCPKCSTRVGSFNWSGNQCSCGTWITPAIQITKKSVDDRFILRAGGGAGGAATGE